MNKQLMSSLALALTVSASALAAESAVDIDTGKLVCTGDHADLGKVALSVKTFMISGQNQGRMIDAEMSVTFVDSDDKLVTSTGRRDNVAADANYKPTKYKEHSRFDMNQLIEVESTGDIKPSFGRFEPIDMCQYQVLIPNHAFTGVTSKSLVKKFNAPVTVNCDQGGGAMTLSCTLTGKVR